MFVSAACVINTNLEEVQGVQFHNIWHTSRNNAKSYNVSDSMGHVGVLPVNNMI